MKKIACAIYKIGRIQDHQQNEDNELEYVLILKEIEGKRILRIPMLKEGLFLISVMLDTSIDLSDDDSNEYFLPIKLLKTHKIIVNEIYIHSIEDDEFLANIVSIQGADQKVTASNADEAITLAVRLKVPIYISEHILKLESMDDIIALEENTITGALVVQNKNIVGEVTSFDKYSIPQLNKAIENAIEEEDYLKAAKLRDELKRR